MNCAIDDEGLELLKSGKGSGIMRPLTEEELFKAFYLWDEGYSHRKKKYGSDNL